MTSLERPRVAVLIDADNVSSSHAASLLAAVAKHGRPTIRRAYGDWTTNRLCGWKQELNKHAITPFQQFAYTSGKNATDSALIIDAMDLLYTAPLDAFALISSDSDFTRLATRLREAAKTVYGYGNRGTPEAFRQACDQFTYVEELSSRPLLVAAASTVAPVPTPRTSSTPAPVPQRPTTPAPALAAVMKTHTAAAKPVPTLEKLLRSALAAESASDPWVKLSTLGTALRQRDSSFSNQKYGHSTLTKLVQAQTYLQTKNSGTCWVVRLKAGKVAKATPATRPA